MRGGRGRDGGVGRHERRPAASGAVRHRHSALRGTDTARTRRARGAATVSPPRREARSVAAQQRSGVSRIARWRMGAPAAPRSCSGEQCRSGPWERHAPLRLRRAAAAAAAAAHARSEAHTHWLRAAALTASEDDRAKTPRRRRRPAAVAGAHRARARSISCVFPAPTRLTGWPARGATDTHRLT